MEQQSLQLSWFDRRNLAEIHSPDFPGERLIVCFNPMLAEERQRKRQALLEATEKALDKLVQEVKRRTRIPLSAAEIGRKVGQIIQRFKVAKHFETVIADGRFSYRRRTEAIEREAQLDGIYVNRTSEPEACLSAEDTVRSYKNLARVERAFRTLKGIELSIRPIRHHTENRVRARIFLCLLAYLVEWHLRQAWLPLLFDDEQLETERQNRDPVAPARPSDSARQKKASRLTEDAIPVHSFTTRLAELGTLCRHRCRLQNDPESPPVIQATEPTPIQVRALDLVRMFPVAAN